VVFAVCKSQDHLAGVALEHLAQLDSQARQVFQADLDSPDLLGQLARPDFLALPAFLVLFDIPIYVERKIALVTSTHNAAELCMLLLYS